MCRVLTSGSPGKSLKLTFKNLIWLFNETELFYPGLFDWRLWLEVLWRQVESLLEPQCPAQGPGVPWIFQMKTWMNESLHGVTQCSRVALLCILLIHSYLQSQTSWHNSRPFKVIEQRQARCTLSTLLNLGGEWVLQQAWEFWRGEGTGSNSNWLCDYEQITVPLGFLFWKITAWKYHLLRPPWALSIPSSIHSRNIWWF